MLEAGVVLYALEMEVMQCLLLRMLEALEGGICLPEVEVVEVMRCVLLCMSEGGLCLSEVVEVLAVMRCVLGALQFSKFAGGAGSAAGDALCATLYAGGSGGWALFAGGDALCAIPYAGGCGG